MIITNLIGGLGNQMFQYAASRALSLRRDVSLRLDLSGFAGYKLHQGFELHRVFGCGIPEATAKDMRSVLGYQAYPLVRRLLVRPSLRWLRSEAFIVEPHFNHWPGINAVPVNCWLAGYWQSQKYFGDKSQQIRRDFRFAEPMSARNAAVDASIRACNAVSLHVRRGDYANNAQNLATHGLCTPDYYRAAIQYFIAHIANPVFFVFSDDIPWASQNLDIPAPHEYVDHNREDQSFNDMRLMAACQHHIIANSSFSWWGAWLNPQPQKIVVAPAKWFARPTMDWKDLLPESWVRM